MSHKTNPPRQDRRGKNRAVVMKHAGKESVGTSKTILDPTNGNPFSTGGNSGSAPGSAGNPDED